MRKLSCLIGVVCAVYGVGAFWLGQAQAEVAGAVPGPRISFHEDENSVRGVKLRLYLKTDPERVWELVTNSKKAVSLFKNVSSISPSSKGPRYSDYHLSSAIGEKIVTCLVSRNDARRHLSWRRVEGSLTALYGYFKVDQDPNHPQHVRFEYASYVDPGGIGRILMTDRRRRGAAQHMLTKLRALVGAATNH